MQTELEKTELSPARILEFGACGNWGPKVLMTAVELGLFTVLAQGPLDAQEIRQCLDLHERSVRDFLDSLVALNFLERNEGIYSNVPETDLFLDRAKPCYLGDLIEMNNSRLYFLWGSLTEALRTGQPQNESKTGGDFFAQIYADPQRLRCFVRAMSSLTVGPARVIAQKFPWDQYETVVDIGCAQGAFLVHVARAHSHLRGIGFDLAALGSIFDKYVERASLGDRLRFKPGDFFADSLPAGDVLVLGHILHDWDLATRRTLLDKCYAAIPPGGALIVYDALIDDERRRDPLPLLVSLNMLIETPSGSGHTGAECGEWMQDAGFRQVRVEHLLGAHGMVVGIKER